MQPYSLYLHIPFCKRRCSYCDFNTYAGQEYWIPKYVDALCAEIEAVSEAGRLAFGRSILAHTIFFGGGTPSILPVSALERILDALSSGFDLQQGFELSLEANPGTVNPDTFSSLQRLGFNRVSFGMQTANPEELRLLRRVHDYLDVANAVRWARLAGFQNLNLDLIFALPGQSLESWQQTLRRALDLNPDHFSLYSLIVEPGTAMQRWVGRGLVPTPDDDLAADMYEWAGEKLESEGYYQYEISNWARKKPDGQLLSCRHNLQYWRNLPYFGFGAGAHGFSSGVRTANVMGIEMFVKRCLNPDSQYRPEKFPAGPALDQATLVDYRDEMQETMMVGLRLTEEGVSRQAFCRRFEQAPEDVFTKELSKLLNQGLIEYAGEGGDIIRLTKNGRLVGNRVFMEFVA